MKVLLLAGGTSNERDVSLTSGKAVCEALSRGGHDVVALDPADGGSLLDAEGQYVQLPSSNSSKEVVLEGATVPALATALGRKDLRDVDVVFIALHGGSGENGVIQCLLELAGLPYTGSNMTASAVAMNKAMAKRLFTYAGIPTPEWILCSRVEKQQIDQVARMIAGKFSLPVIVKPNDGGSTIGLTRVVSEDQLPQALARAQQESQDILIEQYIPGRELTVAVLEENDDARTLPVVEIKPKSGLYDYEAKYTKGKSDYICPADLDAKIARKMQATAKKAYEVIGCTGLVRVDFILAEDFTFYCLEVNTIPGMTSLSLAPMAAKAAGIDFDELIARLLHAALKRFHD
ncbi:MAG: D-alanine--D-alanine ligase [Candidatus Zixiibacteriota bacterium]